MSLKRTLLVLAGLGAIGGALVATGHLELPQAASVMMASREAKPPEKAMPALAPAVTVVRAAPAEFASSALVTGSLVAREEILVGPEIDGLRVVEVLAEEGDRVAKGQVLARLVSDTLEAQLAQNTAALARTEAAIAQARSAISSAEARLEEARNAYDRASPLTKSGYLSESTMDQREMARRTAEATLASSRDGLKLAEAEKAQVAAQRREISWRRERTEIRAPADGIVSRRNARIGSYASGLADPMFRIIAKGEIELDAEVTETRLGDLRVGQNVRIDAAGAGPGAVKGTVRLISPEVDPTTRLGRVRIYIGDQPGLRIGSFARGVIETASSRGISVPATAVLYGVDGPVVQIVSDGLIRTHRVVLGLSQGVRIEVRQGLAAGDLVVARSGTFLREGDAVRPMPAEDRRPRVAG
ncbi:MAG: efflux RND transporter periplasmic adaptor subunit [Hyphomicrobiaceae bacterium]|nr:efflux RND transporter periplasmic adaptor subunit [Hyphomicrobiaceae bacterium]